MSKHPIVLFLASLLAILPAACSGGSSDEGAVLPSQCGDPDALCLVECNLGCTSSGSCTITDIAPNQPLQFIFSQEIDPRSVDFGSFSIKTPTGVEPVGEFFIDGPQIDFVPTVSSAPGANTFGFVAGETYILTIPAAADFPAPVTSIDGDRLLDTFSCTVRITRPVIDLDGLPPSAVLESPSAGQQNTAPRNAPIVLRFSEILDARPFVETGANAPVQFNLHRTSADANGNLVCNLTPDPFELPGVVRLLNDVENNVTRVEFQPQNELPGAACVEVLVTPQVRDLAGTAAEADSFTFITEATGIVDQVRTFDFQSSIDQDVDRSSGPLWSGGTATFVSIGGNGELGDFEVTDGLELADGSFLFSTDNQIIPRKATGFVNGDAQILDGVFRFTQLEVPAGRVVRFEGSQVARILVRGKCDIRGRLLVNGREVPGTHDGKNSTVGVPFDHGEGQQPPPAGPFGGSGGAGGWACAGTGSSDPLRNDYNGYDGEDMNVPGAHVYAGSEVGTGGKGSVLFPSSGLNSAIVYGGFGGIYALQAGAGGGGGGYRGAGLAGEVIAAGSVNAPPNTNPAQRGPSAQGGVTFPDMLSRPNGVLSSDFFLIGGSGGGGGGSNPLFANSNQVVEPYKYWSGGAGGGGGGVLWLRVGGSLEISPTGRLEARGGDVEQPSSPASFVTRGAPAPGGGGSGGSMLVQVGRDIIQQGEIDVTGGVGGPLQLTGFQSVNLSGGDGAPGMFRIEAPDTAPALVDLGTTLPAAVPGNVGVIEEVGAFSGFQSKTITVPAAVFPPVYLRYEIDAVVDGNPVTFSDDPNTGFMPASPDNNAALHFWVQGIVIDPVTGLPDIQVSPGPWRRNVGTFGPGGSLNTDATLGYRFQVINDLGVSSNVVVEEVRIVFRT